jgi:hypothetical protein
MYGTPEMATQRQLAMRREAQAYSLTKETRAGRSADRRAGYRRVVTATLAMVAWPVKH